MSDTNKEAEKKPEKVVVPEPDYVYNEDPTPPELPPLPDRWQKVIDTPEDERDENETILCSRVLYHRNRKTKQRTENTYTHSMQDWKSENKDAKGNIQIPNKVKWNLPACHFTLEGMRQNNEDSYMIGTLDSSGKYPIYGVFDGHAGPKAAEFIAEKFLEIYQKVYKSKKPGSKKPISDQLWAEIHKKAHSNMDDYLYENMEKYHASSGATTVVVVHDTIENKLRICHLGDSRALIFNSDNDQLFETTDHKPGMESEKERIIAAGGIVEKDRVMGDLAISRALGDFRYKNRILKGQNAWRGYDPEDVELCKKYYCHLELVSFDPEINNIDLSQVAKEGSNMTMLIACDGIFDMYKKEAGNRNLIKLINEHLYNPENIKDRTSEEMLRLCARNTAWSAYDKGSGDNISVLLVKL